VDCCSVNAKDSERQVAEGDGASVRAPSAGSYLKRASALMAAVGIALLPKCPACWSVYAGLSSWLGVSLALEPRRLLPLTLASLALALLSLAAMARRSGRYVPLLAGALSALGVWAGKFVLSLDLLTYLSLFGLIIASLSARRLGTRRATGSDALARMPGADGAIALLTPRPGTRSSRARQSSELPEHAEAR
jgi:hypothetical protein